MVFPVGGGRRFQSLYLGVSWAGWRGGGSCAVEGGRFVSDACVSDASDVSDAGSRDVSGTDLRIMSGYVRFSSVFQLLLRVAAWLPKRWVLILHATMRVSDKRQTTAV